MTPLTEAINAVMPTGTWYDKAEDMAPMQYWCHALSDILTEYHSYTDGSAEEWQAVNQLCRNAMETVASTHVNVNTFLSQKKLTAQLRDAIYKKSTSVNPARPLPRYQQRYHLAHELSVLLVDATDLSLFTTHATRNVLEQRHPGVLAAAASINVLYEEMTLRRMMLVTWHESQTSTSVVNLSLLGDVTPLC